MPAGSGNDAARSLGLPLDPVAAARSLIDGHEVLVDLGTIAGRRFCNVAGVGLDGEVCRLLAASAIPLHGRAAYVAAFLATAANLRASPLWLQEDDGQWQRLDVLLISFANGPYYGGGMRIAPNADPRDGALDRCALLATGKLELVRAFPRVYRGTHVTHPSIPYGWCPVKCVSGNPRDSRDRRRRRACGDVDKWAGEDVPQQEPLIQHIHQAGAPQDALARAGTAISGAGSASLASDSALK